MNKLCQCARQCSVVNLQEAEQSMIKHFSLKEWNQSTLIRDFIRLIELIDKWEASLQNGPIVIHCV